MNINLVDTSWVMTCSILMFFILLPGITLFYAGLVRKENIITSMIQSLLCLAITTIVWISIGYSLANTDGNFLIGNTNKSFLHNMLDSQYGTIPELLNVFYDIAYAALAAAIIFGAVQDRIRFNAFLIFVPLWLLLVFCPVYHMIWGTNIGLGYLKKFHSIFSNLPPILDFAGGLVLQVCAGVSGLVLAIILGPAHIKSPSYYDINRKDNVNLSIIGLSLMWVGWFGFIGGASYSPNKVAVIALINTQISASVGAIMWMCLDWWFIKRPNIRGIMCGAVSGLVAITPAAGYVGPAEAVLIAIASTLASNIICRITRNNFSTYETLDVFGIHCVSGIMGVLLTGIYANSTFGSVGGVIEGNYDQFISQIIGCVLVVTYSAIVTYVILLIIKIFTNLRVEAEEEFLGIDLVLLKEE